MSDFESADSRYSKKAGSASGARPLISVVMPCFNAEKSLSESVGSVLRQNFMHWELVVVDDGSTDDSVQILEGFAEQDPRIRLFRQQNSGSAAARNLALHHARGSFVAFLDADDTWDEDFLGTMQEVLIAHPEAGIAYCGWKNLGLAGGRGEPYVPPDYEGDNKAELLLGGCPWPIHAVLVRANILRSAGGFDSQLEVCVDYDLWLRTAIDNRLVRVPRVLAYYHFHENDQVTANKARLAFNHRRAQMKFLEANPGVANNLGQSRVRELTDGEMLNRGFVSYWARDLPTARKIFRAVMRSGYGKPNDWKYMLPSLLPLPLHRALIGLLERKH